VIVMLTVTQKAMIAQAVEELRPSIEGSSSLLKALRHAATMCEGDYIPTGSGEMAVSDLLLKAGNEIERLLRADLARKQEPPYEPDFSTRGIWEDRG
jgi:hypothetical protein